MKNFISRLNKSVVLMVCRLMKFCVYMICGMTTLCSLSVTAQIPLKNISKVESGSTHTCALTNSGGVKCWGFNEGKLGDGTTLRRNVPVDVVGLTSNVVALSVGGSHSCALMNTGGVKCWGENGYGQLGNPANTYLVPADVIGLTSGVAAISAGHVHTCAVMNSGGVKCWGSNFYGRLGDGSIENQHTPVDVIGLTDPVVAVSAAQAHTCALTNLNAVKCWGNNDHGQLGNGTNNGSGIPVNVASLLGSVAKIDTGSAHTCALLVNGSLKCWGNNSEGRLGNGSLISSNVPVDVTDPGVTYIDVSAGSGTTCALTTIGDAKCWGRNSSGQLGTGSTVDSAVPVDVYGLATGVNGLSAYDYVTCAVINNGANCWGGNSYGQIGDNTTQNRNVPTTVLQSFSPQIGLADAGNTQAIVRFSPPVDDSGHPVTGYTVISIPAGGIDVYAGTTDSHTGPDELSHLVTGLVNGTSYRFNVIATNALGTGLPSAVSNIVVPSGGISSSSAQSILSSQSSSAPGSSISSIAISSVGASSSLVNINSSSVSSVLSSVHSSIVSSSVMSSRNSSSSSSIVGGSPCSTAAATMGSVIQGALVSTDCRSGTRGSNYYVDRYLFSGVPGQQISIQLTSTAFDTFVYLKNPSGAVVTSNDDGGGGTNSRIPASSGTYTLSATGNFVIEVTSYSSLKTGAYTLLVNTPAPVSPCKPVMPITAWVDTYGSLATTDCITGARGANYYADSYYFIGMAGQRIVIDFISSDFSSYIFLRNPAGTVITSDTGSGSLGSSRIPSSGTFTLPVSGIYVIEATSYLAGKTGFYKLVLTQN